jgi:hypothetical protein
VHNKEAVTKTESELVQTHYKNLFFQLLPKLPNPHKAAKAAKLPKLPKLPKG